MRSSLPDMEDMEGMEDMEDMEATHVWGLEQHVLDSPFMLAVLVSGVSC